MSSVKKDMYGKAETEKNKIEAGVLYLVATPIGNLSDLSERAIKVLSEVDFIAAEDTRNSVRMLTHLGIKKPLVSYFEHNKRERGEVIAKRLEAGESCALITDAGTPAISDPGEDLVALCAERNIKVTSIPGACAAVTALTLSALPTGRFAFEGFLSTAKSERAARLKELSAETRTMIFYEAPHKLRTTLDDFVAAFGDRKVALCRELTKLNEEIMRTTLEKAKEYYGQNEPRGEYVIIIEGNSNAEQSNFFENMSVEEHVNYYINSGLGKTDAIKAAAKDRGVPKNVIYNEFVKNS